MLTFYLVRHGTKEAVPFDPPLTKIGIKQAETTADHLKHVPFKKIVASPKLRTKQTAEIIAKQQALSVEFDQRLIERLEWETNQSLD
jgi:broad specificity phosphatase PhoE